VWMQSETGPQMANRVMISFIGYRRGDIVSAPSGVTARVIPTMGMGYAISATKLAESG
jgi:hypothetical protein